MTRFIIRDRSRVQPVIFSADRGQADQEDWPSESDWVVGFRGQRGRHPNEPVQSLSERQALLSAREDFLREVRRIRAQNRHFWPVIQQATNDRERGLPRRSGEELVRMAGLSLSPTTAELAARDFKASYDNLYDLRDTIQFMLDRLVIALKALPRLPATDEQFNEVVFAVLSPDCRHWINALNNLPEERLGHMWAAAMTAAGYPPGDAWLARHLRWPYE